MATSKGTAEDEEPESVAAAAGAARGKVVSAMMRKHLVEGMVPVLAELKRMLEACRHSLLHQLMLTLRVLLKDHKSEVSCDHITLLCCTLMIIDKSSLDQPGVAAKDGPFSRSPSPKLLVSPHLEVREMLWGYHDMSAHPFAQCTNFCRAE